MLPRRILFSALRKQCRFYSVQKSQELLQELGNSAISENDLTLALSATPELSQQGNSNWQKMHQFLVNQQNFPKEAFLPIVVNFPAIFSLQPESLSSKLEAWRECQFGEVRTQDLLIKHPRLIQYGESRRLRSRMSLMQGYVQTPKNVWKIFMSNPNVVYDHEKEITEKMDYLWEQMRVEVPEITKSEVLSHSIEHIKARHTFMVRLGLYKTRSEKAVLNNEKNTNVRLVQITDTSDKTFARKVCHVTLEEYEVFVELLRREWAREGIDDEDENFDDLQHEQELDR